MTLSHNDTKRLIELVLTENPSEVRKKLRSALQRKECSEGQFYDGIAKHGPSLRLSTEQWFELLSRLPNRFLRSQLSLPGILSEEQIKRLPPATG